MAAKALSGWGCPHDEFGPLQCCVGALPGSEKKTAQTEEEGEEGSGEEADDSSTPMSSSDEERGLTEVAPPCPRRILDRLDDMAQREEGLARAQSYGDRRLPLFHCELHRITVRDEVSSLSLRHFGDARFLLILPSVELADRVYHGGRPFISSELRCHIMRWPQFLNSMASSLPALVEVDICGIPAHAWDFSTVELLLCDNGWIDSAHPDTADHRDVFKVVAWCSIPKRIPSTMELQIVEPAMAFTDPQPGKRSLVYPISLSFSPIVLSSRPGDPPSPPPVDDGERHHDRSRQDPPPPPNSACGAPWTSVHVRLGPLPDAIG